ncbi:MAG: hypothetical protein MJZ11_08760 [Lachnospiraceae bacterium]|nr:hypothetical protein [Lachnospiraceae bacterium]
MPETIFGYDYVTKAYSEKSIDSARKIVEHMQSIYPVATSDQIKKIIGVPVERKTGKNGSVVSK